MIEDFVVALVVIFMFSIMIYVSGVMLSRGSVSDRVADEAHCPVLIVK